MNDLSMMKVKCKIHGIMPLIEFKISAKGKDYIKNVCSRCWFDKVTDGLSDLKPFDINKQRRIK